MTECPGTARWTIPPLLLRTRLRVLGLVLERVGHRAGESIHELGMPSLPQPRRRRLLFQFVSDLDGQFTQRGLRQLRARFAIDPSVGRWHRQPLRQTLRGDRRHRRPTRGQLPVTQHLSQKGPQHVHRRNEATHRKQFVVLGEDPLHSFRRQL